MFKLGLRTKGESFLFQNFMSKFLIKGNFTHLPFAAPLGHACQQGGGAHLKTVVVHVSQPSRLKDMNNIKLTLGPLPSTTRAVVLQEFLSPCLRSELGSNQQPSVCQPCGIVSGLIVPSCNCIRIDLFLYMLTLRNFLVKNMVFLGPPGWKAWTAA